MTVPRRAVIPLGTLLALSLSLAHCSSTPARAASRTVVLSLDGVGGLRLNALLAAGELRAGGFSAFAERGLLAGRAIDVTPSLTPSAHISAITGAPPSKNGIVGHYFYEPGAPFGRRADGFAADIQTETLWEAATRQGKRVGVILFPGADGRGSRRRGAFGMTWPERAAKASVFMELPAAAWVNVPAPPTAITFSPSREARVSVALPHGATISLRLVALDSTDDGRVDYDLFRVVRAANSGASGTALGEIGSRKWFPLEVRDSRGALLTSWCRLAEIAPDLSHVVLYVGAFYELPAYPEEFRAKVQAEVGGWPGPPDEAFLKREGAVDENAVEEQALRLDEFLSRVLVLAARSERWDLLIGYQPLVDEIEHSFEPARGSAPGPRVTRAFQSVDRSVAAVLGALRPDDSMLVLSDHGMASLTAAVNLDRFLRDRGWTIAREKDGLSPSPRRVQVNAGSGIAHLYVDPALDAAARVESADALLAAARSLPAELVDMILPRAELSRAGLEHPRSGDVVILLRPGIEFSTSHEDAIGPAHQKGGHGYRNAAPDLDAAFMELGPGVARAHPDTVSILEVAPRAARCLGIESPSLAPRQRGGSEVERAP